MMGCCESKRSDARLASEDRRAGATWAEDQRVQLTGPEREKEPVPEGRDAEEEAEIHPRRNDE